MDAVIRNSGEDIDSGKSTAEWIYDLSRQDLYTPDPNNVNDNDRFTNYDDSMNPLCMIVDRGLNLSLLTENLYSDLDPRMCGNEMGIEITMADMPPTISGIHGSLLVYSMDVDADPAMDTRQLFKFTNLRAEIDQQFFPSNPFPPEVGYTHTFLDWQVSAQSVYLTRLSTHRFQLGQILPQRTHARRLLMWVHAIPDAGNPGTSFANTSHFF